MAKIYNPLNERVRIPKHKKNIILDFFGTMVYENPQWDTTNLPKNIQDANKNQISEMILRPGILSLLEAYDNKSGKKIIHSDTSLDQIKLMLNGTNKYIDGICAGDKYMHMENIYNLKSNLYELRGFKELKKTCRQYNLSRSETIFFGDSIIDIDSAKKYGMDMIWIPNSEVYPKFNFEDLIQTNKKNYFLNKD